MDRQEEMKRRILRISLAMVVLIGLWSTLLSAEVVQADMRDLRVEGKKPAEYVAAQSGKSWAVVIGINEYHESRIHRLNGEIFAMRQAGRN